MNGEEGCGKSVQMRFDGIPYCRGSCGAVMPDGYKILCESCREIEEAGKAANQ